jgi:hypothetical protein
MSLHAALAQGTWRTFIYGERYFDPPLWTMKPELYGSVIAFSLAAVLIFVRQRTAQIVILFCAAALAIYLVHVLMIFSGGTSSFVLLEPSLGYTSALVVSVAVSIAGTIIVAYLLTLFEGYWVPFVNWAAGQVLGIIGLNGWQRLPKGSLQNPG